jgi:hypothetical protein
MKKEKEGTMRTSLLHRPYLNQILFIFPHNAILQCYFVAHIEQFINGIFNFRLYYVITMNIETLMLIPTSLSSLHSFNFLSVSVSVITNQ